MKIQFPNFDNVTLFRYIAYVRLPELIEQFIRENGVKIYVTVITDEHKHDITFDEDKVLILGRVAISTGTYGYSNIKMRLENCQYWLEHDNPEIITALRLMW